MPSTKSSAACAVQKSGPWPRHPVKHNQPQAFARHIHAVPDGVGTKQAGVRLMTENVHKRRGIHRVHVLGVKRDVHILKRTDNMFIGCPQPTDGSKKPERATTRCKEQ